ncbi:MAG: 50S ribosomal protein L15 [Spirochaetales bacterium]|nr:50S ribosomal protein L15 [Spirochaetales bacterium]
MGDMDIRPPDGSRKSKRIDGRGNSGRRGGRAGKGNKGQNARAGGGVRPGFEGGQMPLYRRIPRKGFSNFPFKREFEVVNVATLDKKYADGETVSIETLREKRIVKKKSVIVKILGEGELTKKLTVQINAVSAQARAKIEMAGGTVAEAPVKTGSEKDNEGNVDGE